MDKNRNLSLAGDRVVRAEEVRQMLGGIGRNTLYEWCRQGLIPHTRVGGVILFSSKSIQKWLENDKNEGGTQ